MIAGKPVSRRNVCSAASASPAGWNEDQRAYLSLTEHALEQSGVLLVHRAVKIYIRGVGARNGCSSSGGQLADQLNIGRVDPTVHVHVADRLVKRNLKRGHPDLLLRAYLCADRLLNAVKRVLFG